MAAGGQVEDTLRMGETEIEKEKEMQTKRRREAAGRKSGLNWEQRPVVIAEWAAAASTLRATGGGSGAGRRLSRRTQSTRSQ